MKPPKTPARAKTAKPAAHAPISAAEAKRATDLRQITIRGAREHNL